MSRFTAASVQRRAHVTGARTGQALFDMLPDWASSALVGSTADPYERDLNRLGISRWMHDHLIYDDRGDIIGVMSDTDILAERPAA